MTAAAAGTWVDATPARPRAPWLDALRARAAEEFRASGFPTRRDEDWRHTNLSAVTRTAFGPAPEAEGRIEHEGPRLLVVNGRPSAFVDVPDGVEVARLAEAVEQDDEGLDGRLGALVDGRGHAFAALNTALFEDGLLVRVRRGVAIERPLHLAFLTSGGSRPAAVHPRLLFVLEDGAELGVVETWSGRAGAPWLSNTVVEVLLGPNARLDLLEIQDQPENAFHFRSLEARLDRDARFTSTCFSFGAKLARNDVRVRLAAPGAECRLDGLTLVTGDQHADHATRIDHAEPHGTSHQLYKGVLDGRATTAFSGRVLVEPYAQKTDARQANHNLLLSPDAVADSKPQLEIFADDVKCAHGATVGQLDENAIFYLRSRGLGLDAARMLLLKAFAGEVPERIENEALRAHAQARLERRLPGGA